MAEAQVESASASDSFIFIRAAVVALHSRTEKRLFVWTALSHKICRRQNNNNDGNGYTVRTSAGDYENHATKHNFDATEQLHFVNTTLFCLLHPVSCPYRQ
jgi:hypothetical protein